MIQLQNVTKLYRTVIGVNDITLELEQGAYGLVGPNGSGKSTLLNLITGQLRSTLGHVRVYGNSPWNNTDVLRRIGVCPELDVLYPNVSGYEWVRYLMELRGVERSQSAKVAAAAMDQVGMAESMHRRMGTYSRGMRQRTKLAQAFAHNPDLLILDEPFNGLDPIARHEITVLLREWIRQGRGMLLASHILHEVESITRSFLLICNGRLLASGSIGEVQNMLADVPNEIQLRCDGAARLACRLIDEDIVDTLRFEEKRQTLIFSTRTPTAVYTRLAEWADGEQIRIHEMRCANESLQSLFNSLLQIHRGKL